MGGNRLCDLLLLRHFSVDISEWSIHETTSGDLANDLRYVSAVFDVPALPHVPERENNHGNLLLV